MRTRIPRDEKLFGSPRHGRNAYGEKDKAPAEKLPLAKVGVHRALRKLTKPELPASGAALHGQDSKAPRAAVPAMGRKSLKHSELRFGEHFKRRKIRSPRA